MKHKITANTLRAKNQGRKTVKITLIRSLIGRLERHKACVRGLGFRRVNQTVEVLDTPENRGMIRKVNYLLRVEE